MPSFSLIVVSLWMFSGALAGLPDPPAATAQLSKSVRVEHYDVAGTTWQALAQEMRTKGPGDFFGQTVYQIGYRYTAAQAGGQCRVGSATVSLDVRIVLPRWERHSQASSTTPYDLRRDWGLFHARLERHEREHARLAERGAEAVRQYLLTAAGACATFDQEVNRQVRALVDAWDVRNRGYDERTGHGRTEGAVWPVGGAVAQR